jgi:hypothetical protein
VSHEKFKIISVCPFCSKQTEMELATNPFSKKVISDCEHLDNFRITEEGDVVVVYTLNSTSLEIIATVNEFGDEIIEEIPF